MQLTRRRAGLATVLPALAVLALSVAAVPAGAQDVVDIAAAKKEGKIVWYTSTPVETANKIGKLFETEYGIKVEMFRSGGSAILRRFQQEMQAGRVMTDVLTTSDPAASAQLARKGTFVAFKPKNFDKVAPEAKAADGSYIAQRLNMITMYVREDKVTGGDIPKTWADLADPKYKGKLVMTDPSFTALGLMTVATLSKKLGWEYYEKLRKNDIMVVQSNQQVSDMLKRGERLITAGALDSYAADDRKQGHPMLTLYPEDGVLIIPSPTAIIKGAPNPNAAKLFAEFMLSDAVQNLFPEDGGYAARFDIAPPKGNPDATKVKALPLDYDEIEKDSARVKRRFQEIFQ
jgi:iron(III) transport system substrate-binding protein